jgi:hypothetical protein
MFVVTTLTFPKVIGILAIKFKQNGKGKYLLKLEVKIY